MAVDAPFRNSGSLVDFTKNILSKSQQSLLPIYLTGKLCGYNNFVKTKNGNLSNDFVLLVEAHKSLFENIIGLASILGFAYCENEIEKSLKFINIQRYDQQHHYVRISKIEDLDDDASDKAFVMAKNKEVPFKVAYTFKGISASSISPEERNKLLNSYSYVLLPNLYNALNAKARFTPKGKKNVENLSLDEIFKKGHLTPKTKLTGNAKFYKVYNKIDFLGEIEDLMSLDNKENRLKKSQEILKKLQGMSTVGFRPHTSNSSDELVQILEEYEDCCLAIENYFSNKTMTFRGAASSFLFKKDFDKKNAKGGFYSINDLANNAKYTPEKNINPFSSATNIYYDFYLNLENYKEGFVKGKS
ncbi:hypothetical protein [Piscirickettsia litoralis]|uniref:Uncharacterized protein n=1 Tax=Piscirickettsia litoralis TaxID=1891921 RepID=A0ABX2ZYE1_9GAMM|nr:hypothetical protein [Piscirickettsia litoralis]ODN41641.1 hypothetical protein BGC07_16235 [Piscirickettsia litoralis]